MKRPRTLSRRSRFYPGPDLFSRGPTSRVSSALVGLTTVFGMGTGVTPPLEGPRLRSLSKSTAAGQPQRAPRAGP